MNIVKEDETNHTWGNDMDIDLYNLCEAIESKEETFHHWSI